MGVALLACRLGLATVFLTAAIAKLVDPAGSRRALESFGVPRGLPKAVGVGLPLVELTIGLALISSATAAWAAAAAVFLLSILTVALIRAIRRGVEADCHCFGQLGARPIGGWTVARNVVLLALAAFIAIAGWDDAGTSASAWVADLAALEMALIAVLVLWSATAAFAWQLLRQNGRLLLRLDAQAEELGAGGAGLDVPPMDPQREPGTAAPALTTKDLDGEPLSLESLLSLGRPVALVFTDPDCGACEGALAEAAVAQRESGDELTVAVIARGEAGRMREKADALGLVRVVHDPDDEVFTAYRMRPVPAAQLIGADGRVLTPRAVGTDAVRDLIADATVARRVKVRP